MGNMWVRDPLNRLSRVVPGGVQVLVPCALSRAARTKKSESCRYFYALTWGAANLGTGLYFFWFFFFSPQTFRGSARTMGGGAGGSAGSCWLAGRRRFLRGFPEREIQPVCHISSSSFVLSYPVLFCLLCSACLSYSCLPIQRDGRVGFLVSAVQKEVMCTFYVGTDVGEIESQQRIKFAGGFGGIPNLASGCSRSVFFGRVGWRMGKRRGFLLQCDTHRSK